ncbi:hypothetical protein ACFS7Z_20405 [Pontibacter toksunensis]|uniref:Uncharacterized protein n=1 Tax=Pontibacter toksunensis TaxID=1332631 RepID=A0ABW6BY66_9BACT
MCYYYTVKEYATIKKLDLSVHDEAAAIASATMLSNKRGIPINKVYCGKSEGNISCYASRILREAVRPAGKKVNAPFDAALAGAFVSEI